jgi:hypothetical protein
MLSLKTNFKQALDKQQNEIETRLSQLNSTTVSQTQNTVETSQNNMNQSNNELLSNLDKLNQDIESNISSSMDGSVNAINQQMQDSIGRLETINEYNTDFSNKVEEIKNQIDFKELTSGLRKSMQIRERQIKNSDNIVKNVEKLIKELEKEA